MPSTKARLTPNTRRSAELYPLWIFARLGARAVYDPALQFVPYQWIYMRRPDGQLLRSGDGQGKAPKLRSLLNASYDKDPYVLADYLREPSIEEKNLLFAFLRATQTSSRAPSPNYPCRATWVRRLAGWSPAPAGTTRA